MSTVEIRNIHARVEGSDLWRAEQRVGKERLREVIASAVAAAVSEVATVRPKSFQERVRDLHAAGLCDALIAQELGVVKQRVAESRRGQGLAPNACHRKGKGKR